MLYEDPGQPLDSKERFHIELHFSPGEKINKDIVVSSDEEENESDENDEIEKTEQSEATTIKESYQEKSTENSDSITITPHPSLEKTRENIPSPHETDKIDVLKTSRLQNFVKTAQMHKSAPPGSTDSFFNNNNVGFTVGTPPVDPINEEDHQISKSNSKESCSKMFNNLERVYSGKSDNSGEKLFDLNFQVAGLGTADRNPMFSHKLINGETYETEELMNLHHTKPVVLHRTLSAGKLQSYTSRGTVSAPDISFKRENLDSAQLAQNIITGK